MKYLEVTPIKIENGQEYKAESYPGPGIYHVSSDIEELVYVADNMVYLMNAMMTAIIDVEDCIKSGDLEKKSVATATNSPNRSDRTISEKTFLKALKIVTKQKTTK